MKKLKMGFSIAEILIVLAIVAVIAVIGFNVAKRGLERAYDTYIYTGYKGLTDAITYLNSQGLTADQPTFVSEMAKILDARYSELPIAKSIINKNGIEYRFYNSLDPDYSCVDIALVVPTTSFNINGTVKNKIVFVLKYFYTPNNVNIVLPQTSKVYYITELNSAILAPANNFNKDILNRADLLPFYIDDGIAGRILGGVYQPKKYYSAREAYCRSGMQFQKADGSYEKLPANRFDWNCNEFGTNTNSVVGTIILENPRKLRAF